jgi:hypothetical protein
VGAEMITDDDGRQYKTQEAKDYVYWSGVYIYNSGRADLYDWHTRYGLMQKGVGYILMAAELEPYNPDILWLEAFYTEMSHKTTEYMFDVSKSVVERLKKSVENGYSEHEDRMKRVLLYGLKEYKREFKSGKVWQQ